MRLSQGLLSLIIVQCVGSHLWGQPYVASVANSASYSTTQIAQGSIFTVFGFGLGPNQLQQATSYPLPSQISGTSITVQVGNTVLNCPMVYASYGQASAILPSGTPAGSATLTVNSSNFSSNFNIQVVSSSFGAYTIASSGIGPGIVTGSDYTLKSFSASARIGETVILWGTGLGPIASPDNEPPQVGPQFSGVQVFVGNTPATVVYAGRSGCCAGLDQIAFVVPGNVTGCFVPIAVQTSSGVVSNFTTMPVNVGGGQCTSATPGIPTSILASALAGAPVRLGAIAIGPIPVLQAAGYYSVSQGFTDQVSNVLHRTVSEADARSIVGAFRDRDKVTLRRLLRKYRVDQKQLHRRLVRTIPRAISIDQQGAVAAFGTYRNLASFSPQFAANFTPSGTCTVTSSVSAGSLANSSVARSSSLDAGSSLSFVGPLGARTMTETSSGQYQVLLGSGFTNAEIPAGVYTVSGPGGSGGEAVAPFSASLSATAPITWTNKSSAIAVDRTMPFTFTWSGGTVPGYVLIGGNAHTNGINIAFLCVEDAQKGMFTVPAFVLSALPATDSSDSYFFIAPHPFSNPVSIGGLDLAYFANGSSDYRSVLLY